MAVIKPITTVRLGPRLSTRRHARQQRRAELAAGDEADNECAEAEILMDVKWQYRQSNADDQKGDQDDRHDRYQRRDKRIRCCGAVRNDDFVFVVSVHGKCDPARVTRALWITGRHSVAPPLRCDMGAVFL